VPWVHSDFIGRGLGPAILDVLRGLRARIKWCWPCVVLHGDGVINHRPRFAKAERSGMRRLRLIAKPLGGHWKIHENQ